LAYSEKLADTVREALQHLPDVDEKKMFQGLTFMVDGKMCIGVRDEEIMCRIDPEIYESVRERIGCRPMIHGKRVMKGYVFVSVEGYQRMEDFNFWIELSLDFNKRAKASRKKKK